MYCEANDIVSPEKKRAVLLSVCGHATYQLIRNLVAPEKPAQVQFDVVVEKVATHIRPTRSVIVERFILGIYWFVCGQFKEFCDFKDSLSDMLRDQLVCGVNDERIQRRLLAESELTFDKAFRLAQAAESADKGTRDLKPQYDSFTTASTSSLLRERLLKVRGVLLSAQVVVVTTKLPILDI